MYVIYKNKACVTSSCTIIQHDWGRGGQLQVSVWKKKINVTNSCENKVTCWPSKLPDISCQCGLKHFLTLTQQLTLTHARTVRHCTSNKFVFVFVLCLFFFFTARHYRVKHCGKMSARLVCFSSFSAKRLNIIKMFGFTATLRETFLNFLWNSRFSFCLQDV